MQGSLLQQAEAVWQAQHDSLSSELAQIRQSSQNALVEAQARQSADLQALQVKTYSYNMRPPCTQGVASSKIVCSMTGNAS